MSDYTSTWSKTTGQAIEVADFTTEFNAIEAASATKYDSGDLLDEDDMASDSATKFPSQQSTKAYVDSRLTILDTPEIIVASMTEDAWTTVNSTTLNTAEATAAIIRVYAVHSGVTGTVSGYLRKTGSGVGLTAQSIVLAESFFSTGQGSVGETTVNLDASYDFDYYITSSSAAALSTKQVVLVGYYK